VEEHISDDELRTTDKRTRTTDKRITAEGDEEEEEEEEITATDYNKVITILPPSHVYFIAYLTAYGDVQERNGMHTPVCNDNNNKDDDEDEHEMEKVDIRIKSDFQGRTTVRARTGTRILIDWR
jgi:hypothetical protein